MQIIIGNRKKSAFNKGADRAFSNYKLTAFCIPLQVDEGVLLCHSATGELVLLERDEYQAICSGNSLKGSWAETLAEHLFLPDKDTDEYFKVDCERAERLKTASNCQEITSFTILPTTRCNARCFYCYEKDILQKNMTLETAEDVAAFIEKSCGRKKIHLSWFGGEPTIAYPVINRICERLKEKNVRFESSMISNGLLLNEKMIKTAKACWQLKRIQITIDGTESVYNLTKNYKGIWNNPFKTVLSNINDLLDQKIHVSIRINLGLHNYNDVLKLMQQLKESFKDRQYLSLYVHEIDNYYSEAEYEELRNEAVNLNIKLINENMRSIFELPSIRFCSCMADSNSSILINPEGQLGKCEHYSYEKLCGSIYQPDQDMQVIRKWQEPIQFPRCRHCVFYASCLVLKWCNGGNFVCSDIAVKNKVKVTKDTMQRLYQRWKKEQYNIKNNYYFLLNYHLKVTPGEEGRMKADFFKDNNSEPIRTIFINCTAKDILLFLQEKHTFKDIIEMLHKKYNTSESGIEDDAVKYLSFLLYEGLCKLLCDKERGECQ